MIYGMFVVTLGGMILLGAFLSRTGHYDRPTTYVDLSGRRDSLHVEHVVRDTSRVGPRR